MLDEGSFDDFVKGLLEYRLARALSRPKSLQEAEQVAASHAEEIIEMLDKQEKLIDLAVQRLKRGDRELAVYLLVQAIMEKSDLGAGGVEERLKHLGTHAIPAELLDAARQLLFRQQPE